MAKSKAKSRAQSAKQTTSAKKTTSAKPAAKGAKPAAKGAKPAAKVAKAPDRKRTSATKPQPKVRPKAAVARPARKSPARKTPARSGGERFDRAPYALPLVDLDEAVALAGALLAASPPRPAASVAEEIDDLAEARDRAMQVAEAPHGRASPVETRAHDVAMDRAWSTFVRRIQDHMELPLERRPEAADAARVFAIVRDLSILKLNYFAEFAQIGARIDSLRREGLVGPAREIAGGAFLDEVFHCHAAYGEALGMGDPEPSTPSSGVDRGEARLSLVEAIGEYAVQVMAQARAGRIDTWAPVAAALAPIVLLRQQQEAERHAGPAVAEPAPHPPLRSAQHPPLS